MWIEIMSKFYIKDKKTGAEVPVTKEQFTTAWRRIIKEQLKKEKDT